MAPRGPEHVALGLALREFRETAGLTQRAVAGRSGLNVSYLGGIERGEINVGFANLVALCDALGEDLVALAERVEVHRRELSP